VEAAYLATPDRGAPLRHPRPLQRGCVLIDWDVDANETLMAAGVTRVMVTVMVTD
jgi:hypothetical protein